ncbi:MAG TPA: ComEC/Rec2 family competence protein [Candidatus Andersenbacteria bacterium]|nr:ComEC/Rec2 family competence protein [Candidatus Andersenbacteria bacterium]
MRAFFVLFLLAWLLGLSLGVAHVHMYIASAASALVGAGILARAWRVPYALVAMLLVLLGFIRVSADVGEQHVDCVPASPFAERIIEPVTIETGRVQLITEDQTGCRVLVYAARFIDVQAGDAVQLTRGTIKSLADAREYSAGYAEYLSRRGIGATWLYPEIIVTARERSWTQEWHTAARHSIEKVFTEPEASLALAMLLAEEGTLPEDIVERFRITGISHILAISGFNISLLAGLLLLILLMLPLSPWVRTVTLLAILWSYIVFIGAPTSALRAAVFWTMALAGLRLHLLVSLPAIVLLGSAVLASLLPRYLIDIGWQLSVAAVAGIWLVMFLTRPLLEARSLATRWLVTLLLASLGATLATTPIIAYHFGTVALSSVATNLLVVPLVPALTVLLIVAVAASLVFEPAALLIAYVVHLIIDWFDLVTRVIAAIPYLYWEQVTLPSWAVAAGYGAMALLALLMMKYQHRSWREMWG